MAGDWNRGYAGHVPAPYEPEEFFPRPGGILVQLYIRKVDTIGSIAIPEISRMAKEEFSVGKVLRLGWEADDLDKKSSALRHIKPGMTVFITEFSGAEITFETRKGVKYKLIEPRDILGAFSPSEDKPDPFFGTKALDEVGSVSSET